MASSFFCSIALLRRSRARSDLQCEFQSIFDGTKAEEEARTHHLQRKSNTQDRRGLAVAGQNRSEVVPVRCVFARALLLWRMNTLQGASCLDSEY